jgi:hypothetical protein
VDRPGSDISFADLAAADPNLCEQSCDANGACRAWTYTKPGVKGPAARCYLKGSVPAAVSDPCCVSGIRPPPGAAVGEDMPGSDISFSDLATDDPNLCSAACLGNGACEAWTYTHPGVKGPAARCYLKNARPPIVADPCCVSGVTEHITAAAATAVKQIVTAPSPASCPPGFDLGGNGCTRSILKDVLADRQPSFTISKTASQQPCVGTSNATYQCWYTVTVTNTGKNAYSGPISFVDFGGYADGWPAYAGIGTFTCPETRHFSIACSITTTLAPGASISTRVVLNVPTTDAAKSPCGDASNSVSLTAPAKVGPVWAQATLPSASGCSPSSVKTNGPVPPACPAGWNQVADPSQLQPTWQTQTVTLDGIAILCAKPGVTITPSRIIKLVPLLPCSPLMHHGPDGGCVPNPIILPNQTTPQTTSTPQSSIQCRGGTVKIGRSCVPACPDGSVMPANGYCGRKIIPQTSGPLLCADNQLRLADGSCPNPPPRLLPQTQTPTINLHNALTCPDGQLRLKNGQCPPPKTKLNIKPFILNETPSNNRLH